MPELFRYSNSFEPVLLEGLTATLRGTGVQSDGLNVVCRAITALPEYYKDFGALTASQWDNDNEDTNLEMGKMELAQFRMRVLDDMQLRLKNPSSVQQWRSLRTNFYLPKFPEGDGEDWLKIFMFKASEFFVFENDNTPRFDMYSQIASDTSRILFSGWRFKLEEIKVKGRIDIWLNAWPPSSRSPSS